MHSKREQEKPVSSNKPYSIKPHRYFTANQPAQRLEPAYCTAQSKTQVSQYDPAEKKSKLNRPRKSSAKRRLL